MGGSRPKARIATLKTKNRVYSRQWDAAPGDRMRVLTG